MERERSDHHQQLPIPNKTTCEAVQPSPSLPELQAEQSHDQAIPTPELQPSQRVWEILEREVKHAALVSSRRDDARCHNGSGLIETQLRAEIPQINEELERERHELIGLEDEIYETGTDRERLILDLYYCIRFTSAEVRLPSIYPRDFSLKEFQQFRLQVEPLADEDITTALHRAEEERKQKDEESPKKDNGRRWPPGVARP